MVKTILQVGECSVGVATFFVPAAKLTRLFDLVKASKSVAFLNGPKTSEQPLARLLYDLYHAYGMEYDASAREGFRSFAELEGTFTHLSTAAELMRDLPNIWIAIRQADISEVALDVANLTGLKPCVELLAKAVAT
jgi:hypothetical protein